MVYGSSLLTTLTLALFVAANPVVIRDSLITLPIVRRVANNGTVNLLARDQARVQGLRRFAQQKIDGTLSEDGVISTPAQNQALDYVVNVGVGTPPTNYSLGLDTGSSNTWFGAGKAFVHTSTTVKTGDRVSVTYGSGSFSGHEYTDTVTLGKGLTITQQSIGVATHSEGFDSVDGILGLGPDALTVGTLSPNNGSTIPTVTDNLFSQCVIASNLVGISFEPTNSTTSNNGELTFGGIDSSKFTDPITFFPLTTTYPASDYWGIDMAISYGASTFIQSISAGIVDTGTTIHLIASDAFERYQSATGAVTDAATGLLRITPAQYENLQSLFFTFGGTAFELTPNAQIWPRSLNSLIGGDANSVYLIVNNIGSPTGEGLDFVLGLTFLERFYSVFDTDNRRIGFATTPFTNATTN